MKTLLNEIDDELSAWPKTSSLVRCLTKCKYELEQCANLMTSQDEINLALAEQVTQVQGLITLQGKVNLALMERVIELESQIKNQ